MADNKNNDWMKHIWKELTKPPGWMKEPKKPGSNQSNNQNNNGKKGEAGVSLSPKKRQPPSWWSWSTSDGVPRKKTKTYKKTGTKTPHKDRPAYNTHKEKHSATKAPLPSGEDFGSQHPDPVSSIFAQIRRHGYSPAVLKQYGLTATKVEPFGPVLRLRTNHGLIGLKKTDLDPRQIQFLQQAFTHLEAQNFTKFAPFLLTSESKAYTQIGGETYYATRWIRGQEADLRSNLQLSLAARTLAEFHEASRNFEPSGYNPPAIFDMVDRFDDRRDELIEWKTRAKNKRRPDEVDHLFLAHVDTYVGQANQALDILKQKEVRAHLLFEEDDPVLCHLDLTPYNMIYTQNNQICLIDLDFCTYGPRTLDVAHLLRRALQRQDWDESIARHALVNYNSIRIMKREEYRILYALLLFPHRFWRVAYQHYDIGHDPHHLGYFQLCEAEEKQRQEFLNKFNRQVSHMWR